MIERWIDPILEFVRATRPMPISRCQTGAAVFFSFKSSSRVTNLKPFGRSSQTSSTMLVRRGFLQASGVLLFLSFDLSRSSALLLAVSPPSSLLSRCQLSGKIATKSGEVRCACGAVQRLAKICIDLANDSDKTALQQTALCSSRTHSYGRYTNTIWNFDNPRWKYSASLVEFHSTSIEGERDNSKAFRWHVTLYDAIGSTEPWNENHRNIKERRMKITHLDDRCW